MKARTLVRKGTNVWQSFRFAVDGLLAAGQLDERRQDGRD